MLSGNNHPGRSESAPQENEDLIVQSISVGRYAEAYRLLKKEPAGKVSVLYNLALCCRFAGDHRQALYRLDEALSVFRPALGNDAAPEDEIYRASVAAQNATNTHLSGVTEKYVSRFPEMMKDNILRLKVDCYSALQHRNKVIETAALLKNKGYRNVVEALETAERFNV